MVGFGWYFLGHTQHDFLPLIQVADLGGVYAVIALVAAVNGLVLEWLMRFGGVRKLLRWPRRTDRPGFDRELLGTAAGGRCAAGRPSPTACRGWHHPPFETGPRVAAIQGDVAAVPRRWPIRGEPVRAGTTACACRPRATRGPDLVVWPETCFPYDWFDAASPRAPTRRPRRR